MTRKCGAWGDEHTPYKNTEQNYGADDDFWRHLRVEHNDLSTYPWMSLDVFGANAWNILEPSSCANESVKGSRPWSCSPWALASLWAFQGAVLQAAHLAELVWQEERCLAMVSHSYWTN